MSAIVAGGLTYFKVTAAGAGAVLFPTHIGAFASADDWEGITVEGVGGINVGTKTTTGFTATAAGVYLIVCLKTNVLAHVS